MAIRLIGLVGGPAAAIVLSRFGLTGVAAPAFATFLIAAVVIGELGRVRPEPDQSGATLEVRRIRDYVKGWAAASVLSAGIALLAGLAVVGFSGETETPTAAEEPEVTTEASWANGDWLNEDWANEDIDWSMAHWPDAPLTYYRQGVAYPDGSFCVGYCPDRLYIIEKIEASTPEPKPGLRWIVRFGGWENVDGMKGFVAGSIATVAVTLLLAALAIWMTVRAARAGANEAIRQRDERWRRSVVATIIASVGWIVGLLVAGWALAVALALDPADGALAVVGLVASALVTAAAVVGAGACATHLLRRPNGTYPLPVAPASPEPIRDGAIDLGAGA